MRYVRNTRLDIPLACFKLRCRRLNSTDLQRCSAGLNEKRVKAVVFKNFRNANNDVLPERNRRVKDLLHLLHTPSANIMEMKVADSKLSSPTAKQIRKGLRYKYGVWLKPNDGY